MCLTSFHYISAETEAVTIITYRISPELHFHREIGVYLTFGIRAYRRHRLLLHIPDVFCRHHQARAFAVICNREQPALLHLSDVIEDAI